MRFLPDAQYLLVEAQEAHEANLKRLKAAHANVDYMLCAAGDGDSALAFAAAEGLGGTAPAGPGGREHRLQARTGQACATGTALPEHSHRLEACATRTAAAPVAAVDALVRERNLQGPFLLKLAAHGFEVPTLEGARETLSESAMVVIEAYNFTLAPGALRFHELCAFLESRGFRCADLYDISQRPRDHALWQMDMVFLPSSHPVFESNKYYSESSATTELPITEPPKRELPITRSRGQAAAVGDPAWPRISLVTAVYNGERFLEATMRSILSQGYPNLEYIVVNDGSTDGTADIIRKYEPHLACWINQPNKGLYAALNAGFAKSSGEILGWLNASDMLHTHGLFVVGSVFAAFPEVEWITGHPTVFDERGLPVAVLNLPRWSRYRFLAGANRHIQQESTFWRRSLWEKAGGRMSTDYRAEGDFELWVRFFRHARLHTLKALIGGYRLHEDALSQSNIERYDRNCDAIIERELDSTPNTGKVRLFRKINRAMNRNPVTGIIWRHTVLNALYKLPGPDWSPVIEYRGKWVIRR